MPVVTATDMKAPQIIAPPTPKPTPVLAQPESPNRQQYSGKDPRTGPVPPETPAEGAGSESDAMSPRLAALVRQQKLMRDEQRREKEALQAERAAMQAEKAEIEQVKAWKAKFGSDPWNALIEAGYSPEQATELMLNQPKTQDVQLTRVQQELEAIKKAQATTQQQFQDAQKQQYEQAKKQIGNEVSLLVDSDPSFETIKAMGAQDAVTELIEGVFNKEGLLLSVEEAAKQIEDHLADEAYRLAQLGKIRSRFTGNVTEPPPQQQQQRSAPLQQQQTQTLTNRTSTSPSTSADRRARAIAAFMGKQ